MEASEQRERFPLNAPGDFYVQNGWCITCAIPEAVASNLMTGTNKGHCYFVKQPTTAAEVAQAIEAIDCSCCAALRYGGKDLEILRQLQARGRRFACDELTPPDIEWNPRVD